MFKKVVTVLVILVLALWKSSILPITPGWVEIECSDVIFEVKGEWKERTSSGIDMYYINRNNAVFIAEVGYTCMENDKENLIEAAEIVTSAMGLELELVEEWENEYLWGIYTETSYVDKKAFSLGSVYFICNDNLYNISCALETESKDKYMEEFQAVLATLRPVNF